MYYVIKKSLKIASRNVLEIRFVASMATRVEVERSGTVHYLEQDLGTVLILSCVRNKSARRRSWKEREREGVERGTRDVVLGGQRCKGKFLGQK